VTFSGKKYFSSIQEKKEMNLKKKPYFYHIQPVYNANVKLLTVAEHIID